MKLWWEMFIRSHFYKTLSLVALFGVFSVYPIKASSDTISPDTFASSLGEGDVMAADGSGDVYIFHNGALFKVNAVGGVTLFAGTAGKLGHVDGLGDAAKFDTKSSYGMAIDHLGNLYLLDRDSIRKITPEGNVTTLPLHDGTPQLPDFSKFEIKRIAVDGHNNIYILVGFQGNVLAKVLPNGMIKYLAGHALYRARVDGQGSDARFESQIAGITTDNVGNVYVLEQGDEFGLRRDLPALRVATPDGKVSTFINNLNAGPAFWTGLAMDGAGNFFSLDEGNGVSEISRDGKVTIFAGAPLSSTNVDGTGTKAKFFDPTVFASDYVGNFYVIDIGSLRKISPIGQVTTLIGSQTEDILKPDQGLYLHLACHIEYPPGYQHAWGTAWVTSDKAGHNPVSVNKLGLKIEMDSSPPQTKVQHEDNVSSVDDEVKNFGAVLGPFHAGFYALATDSSGSWGVSCKF